MILPHAFRRGLVQLGCAALAMVSAAGDLVAQQVRVPLPGTAMFPRQTQRPERLVDPEQSALQSLPETIAGERKEKLYAELRRWPPGATITVAFNGGDESLHRRIAVTAMEWMKYGNIGFEFKDRGTGKYRTWSPTDKTYSADVRVAFDEEGYWSYVGRQCLDAKPSEPTLMLAHFDERLPADWRMLVLHQFGHVLGLMHPFQHPDAQAAFQWDDDPDYEPTRVEGRFVADPAGRRPGMHRQLAGPPMNWNREMFEHNFGRIGDPAAFVGPPDPQSVMMYSFPETWFFEGKRSPWYRAKVEPELSAGDKHAIRTWYPFDGQPASKTAEIERQIRSAIASAKSASANQALPDGAAKGHRPIPPPPPPEQPAPGVANFDCGGPATAEVEWEDVTCRRRNLLEADIGDDDRFGAAELTAMVNCWKATCRIAVGDDRIVHPVCRTTYGSGRGIGTAFLIAPDVIMTCYHVVPNDDTAAKLRCEFGYDETLRDRPNSNDNIYELDRVLFHSSNVELDYAVVALKIPSGRSGPTEKWSHTPLRRVDELLYKACPRLIIPQHPRGSYKRWTPGTSTVVQLHRAGPYLRHTGDTNPGSSGAPLFDQSGQLLGLHCGPGKLAPQDDDSRDPERYLSNRAVRIDKIIQHIQQSAAGDQAKLDRIGLRL